MKNFAKTLLAIAFTAGLSTSANATFVSATSGDGAGKDLQTIINGLYSAAGTPVTNAPDVNANQLSYDETWSITATGGSISTFIIQLAGLASTHKFGIYNIGTPDTRVELFNGALSTGDSVTVSMLDTGLVKKNNTSTGITFSQNLFGYYLSTTTQNIETTYFSQAALNGSGADQMVAFRGDGDKVKLPGQFKGTWTDSEYILAWEDIPYGNSDKDFNDLVVMVESVEVPEPGSLALLGLGLAGLGALSRRRQKTA